MWNFWLQEASCCAPEERTSSTGQIVFHHHGIDHLCVADWLQIGKRVNMFVELAPCKVQIKKHARPVLMDSCQSGLLSDKGCFVREVFRVEILWPGYG